VLCDQCDRETHTYCLDPPASAVPRDDPWYCRSCTVQGPPGAGGVGDSSSSSSATRLRRSGGSGEYGEGYGYENGDSDGGEGGGYPYDESEEGSAYRAPMHHHQQQQGAGGDKVRVKQGRGRPRKSFDSTADDRVVAAAARPAEEPVRYVLYIVILIVVKSFISRLSYLFAKLNVICVCSFFITLVRCGGSTKRRQCWLPLPPP
jgi:hypothetical protein